MGGRNAARVRVRIDSVHAKRITLVMANLNTHATASLYEAFTPTEARRLIDRLQPVYTPKHGSWFDITEIELNALSRQCLARWIDKKEFLRSEFAAWGAERNASQTGVDWRFTTSGARIKLKRLYPQIQD